MVLARCPHEDGKDEQARAESEHCHRESPGTEVEARPVHADAASHTRSPVLLHGGAQVIRRFQAPALMRFVRIRHDATRAQTPWTLLRLLRT